MSYTTMFLVTHDGELEEIAEYLNAWGSAARVWESLREQYLPEQATFLYDTQRIWDLWRREDLPDHVRLVLLSTFDCAVIEGERLAEMAAYLRAFVSDFPTDRVDNLPKIAGDLERLAEEKRDLLGVCFHQTSVTDDIWLSWNEEKEERETYDFLHGERHFGVFSSLESQKKKGL